MLFFAMDKPMKNYKILLGIALIVAGILSSAISKALDQGEWRIYQNKDYGFAISYPEALNIQKQFNSAYFIGRSWSVNNADNTSLQHSLVEITLQNLKGSDKNSDGYYYQASVRAGVSSAPADLADCEKPTNNIFSNSKDKQVLLDKKPFSVFTFAEAGMSQFGSGTIYRARVKDICYSIEFIEAGSNNVPDFAAVSEKNKIEGTKIIETFKFVN
jgi:hypothetical protein